jgi:hypothetical protein
MYQKILYYRDWRLLLRVFVISFKISFLCLLKRGDLLLDVAFPQIVKPIKNPDIEKITRYVNFCLFLRKRLGIKDACFTYSLLLCHMLRRAGVDAKVNFGAQKMNAVKDKDISLIGHCWVTVGNEEVKVPHQLIFTHP